MSGKYRIKTESLRYGEKLEGASNGGQDPPRLTPPRLRRMLAQRGVLARNDSAAATTGPRTRSPDELSFSKVRALTRAATPDNESDLLEFALAGSAANLERLVRGWKTLSRSDEAHQERIRHGRRCFSVFPDEDGMYVVKGRLDPEVGAALMRAVEAASDALCAGASKGSREATLSGLERHGNGDTPEPAQLRADAVGLVAERALAAGFGDTAPVSGSATRLWSTSNPPPSARRMSPASPSSKTAPEFPRQLLAG